MENFDFESLSKKSKEDPLLMGSSICLILSQILDIVFCILVYREGERCAMRTEEMGLKILLDKETRCLKVILIVAAVSIIFAAINFVGITSVFFVGWKKWNFWNYLKQIKLLVGHID